MTGHNAKEIGLRTRCQKETLGYNRERLIELFEIFSSFLSDIEHGDRGFSIALLARLARALGLSAGYIPSGTGQVVNVSVITDTLSSLDREYLPELKELLGAYLKTITTTKKQDDQRTRLSRYEQLLYLSYK